MNTRNYTGMLLKWGQFFVEQRILFSRIFALIIAILIFVSGSAWDDYPVADILFGFIGLIMVSVGMLGRIWASLYISGQKTSSLITFGPYSIVRNPLYLFSLVGATGLGMASESMLLTGLILFAFLLYYPMVVFREERTLTDVHGNDFLEYANVTPRFVPDFRLYEQPATHTASVKAFQKAMLDSSYFILLYGLLQILGKLHLLGILPTFLRIP